MKRSAIVAIATGMIVALAVARAVEPGATESSDTDETADCQECEVRTIGGPRGMRIWSDDFFYIHHVFEND